jgi:DNA-binding NarL/FixJ family response regulator
MTNFVGDLKTCCTCGKDYLAVHHFQKKCGRCAAPKARTYAATTKSLQGRPLTPRERQITALVAAGHAHKEVAFRLRLTEGTVKVYLSRIYVKTNVGNHVQLTLWWLKQHPELLREEVAA